MATYFRTMNLELQQSEATAARATVYYEVGTHEAQTITVSKAGGAFGATAGTTGTQVVGTLYKLTIHADDIDTLGEVAFASTGSTDTQYVIGLRVVTHDPFVDIYDMLSDMETNGVLIADAAITPTSIADDAFTAAKFATGSISADALAADAAAEIADAVWEEDVTDHDGTADSVAEALHFARQAAGFGVVEVDEGDNTIAIMDDDGATPLKTITGATVGDTTTWTPS